MYAFEASSRGMKGLRVLNYQALLRTLIHVLVATHTYKYEASYPACPVVPGDVELAGAVTIDIVPVGPMLPPTASTHALS